MIVLKASHEPHDVTVSQLGVNRYLVLDSADRVGIMSTWYYCNCNRFSDNFQRDIFSAYSMPSSIDTSEAPLTQQLPDIVVIDRWHHFFCRSRLETSLSFIINFIIVTI